MKYGHVAAGWQMLEWIIVSMIAGASTTQVSGRLPDAVTMFIRQNLKVSNYQRADTDLNGDGRLETYVYVTDQGYCGSGGCKLVVLSRQGASYRVVLRSTVTQLPITLLPTFSRGWRDIGVTVAGGGTIRPYTARLRFDGRRYPSNPTVLPAIRLKRQSGKVLIGG